MKSKVSFISNINVSNSSQQLSAETAYDTRLQSSTLCLNSLLVKYGEDNATRADVTRVVTPSTALHLRATHVAVARCRSSLLIVCLSFLSVRASVG